MGVVIGLGIGVVVFILLQNNPGGFTLGGRGNVTFGPDGVEGRGYMSGGPVGTNPNFSNPLSSTLISTGLTAGASIASAAAAAGASGGALSSTAAAGIGAGIMAGVAIIGALLAAHQARLKGATNENNAALQLVPVVDDFLQSVVSLVNAGKVTKGQAASALASFDQQLFQQLRSLVGAPGTSWSDSAGMAGKCDKTCTVGCCLYYSDLGPPISLLRYVLGDRGGKWGASDPRLSGKTITVPKVYPGKYSKYTRPLYTLTVKV